jgi:two-component system, NtrC family, sensor kinase
MGKLLLLLLLFVTTCTMAQHAANPGDTPVVVKQLSKEGILLNKGWKFTVGDNPSFANAAYDDQNWQPIDPTKDIHDLPQLWTGICWLRLHFNIDSAIIGSLVMEIQQSGASEIFLNGKLLHRFGIVSTNPDKIKALAPDRPFSLPSARNTEQVLAIRYTLQPHIRYSTHWGSQNRGLSIIVNTIENGNYQYQWRPYDVGGICLEQECFQSCAYCTLPFIYLTAPKKLICSFRCMLLFGRLFGPPFHTSPHPIFNPGS